MYPHTIYPSTSGYPQANVYQQASAYPTSAYATTLAYPSTSYSAPPQMYPAVSSAPPVLYPHIGVPAPSQLLTQQSAMPPQYAVGSTPYAAPYPYAHPYNVAAPQRRQLPMCHYSLPARRRLLPQPQPSASSLATSFQPYTTLYAPVSATYAPVPPNVNLSHSASTFDHHTQMPSNLSYTQPQIAFGACAVAGNSYDPNAVATGGHIYTPAQPFDQAAWAHAQLQQPSTSYAPPLPQHRQSRWSANYEPGHAGATPNGYASASRSSSLPPRQNQRLALPHRQGQQQSTPHATQYDSDVDYAALDRLHVSPVMPRRGGRHSALRPAGPGFSVDDENSIMLGANLTSQSPFGAHGRPTTYVPHSTRRGNNQTSQSMNTVTGILIIHILEGRGIRAGGEEVAVPDDGARWSSDDMYCVLEVDNEHRARTGVSNVQQAYKWRETFEIDVIDARKADIFIYSWHRQHRHKLCHRASLKLLEAFIVDRLSGERTFALTMQPSGQLLVRVGFVEMHQAYARSMAPSSGSYFGLPLHQLVQRENTGVDCPVLIRRIIDEIELRGVDSNGLYMLCGSTEKKRELRFYMERSPATADLGGDAVPDTNVLTSVLKDFLRELPSPLIPLAITRMLVDAAAVRLPNDIQANARLAFGIIDCLPRVERCVLLTVMDHLKTVTQHSPHNHLGTAKLASIFGPLVICTSVQQQQQLPPDIAANAAKQGLTPRMGSTVNALDARLSCSILAHLIDLWPMRCEQASDHPGSIHMSQQGQQLMTNWQDTFDR